MKNELPISKQKFIMSAFKKTFCDQMNWWKFFFHRSFSLSALLLPQPSESTQSLPHMELTHTDPHTVITHHWLLLLIQHTTHPSSHTHQSWKPWLQSTQQLHHTLIPTKSVLHTLQSSRPSLLQLTTLHWPLPTPTQSPLQLMDTQLSPRPLPQHTHTLQDLPAHMLPTTCTKNFSERSMLIK